MNTNIIAVLIVSVSTNWTTIKQHEGQDIQAGLVETNYSVGVSINDKLIQMDAGKAYADELLTRRVETLTFKAGWIHTNDFPQRWYWNGREVLITNRFWYDYEEKLLTNKWYNSPTDSTDLKNNPIDWILWRSIENDLKTNTFRSF